LQIGLHWVFSFGLFFFGLLSVDVGSCVDEINFGFYQSFCQDNIECSFGTSVGLNGTWASIKFLRLNFCRFSLFSNPDLVIG
jgi:hypothetical protein